MTPAHNGLVSGHQPGSLRQYPCDPGMCGTEADQVADINLPQSMQSAAHAWNQGTLVALHAMVLTDNVIEEGGKDGNEGGNADVDAAPDQPNNRQLQGAHSGDWDVDARLQDLAIWKVLVQRVFNHA